MSLQIWLPLNKQGDFTNRGVGDLNIISNAAQYNNEGKIGGCVLCSSSQRLTLKCQDWFKFNPSTKFSVALWIKGCISSESYVFACNSWELRFQTNTIRFYPSQDSSYYPAYWNTTVDPNRWYHICGTWDGHKSCLYVDGELKYTTEIPETATFYDFYDHGDFYMTHSNTSYLNDFRLYDHALSQKEVKEISQGLVVHHKLNDICGKNLFVFENRKYTQDNPYVWTSASKDAFTTECKIKALDLVPGKTYTFSCCTDREISHDHGSSTGAVTLWLYLYHTNENVDYNYNPSTVKAIVFTNIYYSYKEEGYNRYSWRYTIPDGYQACCVRVNHYSDGTNAITSKYWDFKLEEGDVYTPDMWDGVSYDSSGYNNDGTITGDFTMQGDSPRYDKCVKCNGVNNIKLKNPLYNYYDSFTFAFWYKHSSDNKQYNIITCNEDTTFSQNTPHTGWWISCKSEGSSMWVYLGMKYITSNPSIDDKWHHWVVTYTKDNTTNNYKLYLDGVLQNTSIRSKSGYESKTPTFSEYLMIGGEKTYGGFYYNQFGNLSDFRIYSTALSAEDVKDLYETSAIIDNKGNLHAYELRENAENIFTLERLSETINPKYSKDVLQYGLRNGVAAVPINPEWYWYRNGESDNIELSRTSHLGKYFKAGKQYKLDFWVDADDVYSSSTGQSNCGFYVVYTDGSSSGGNLVFIGDINNPKGWQHKTYYTTEGKTVKGLQFSYNIQEKPYYRADSSITEVKDVDIQKSGIVETGGCHEVIEDEILRIYDNKIECSSLIEI